MRQDRPSSEIEIKEARNWRRPETAKKSRSFIHWRSLKQQITNVWSHKEFRHINSSLALLLYSYFLYWLILPQNRTFPFYLENNYLTALCSVQKLLPNLISCLTMKSTFCAYRRIKRTEYWQRNPLGFANDRLHRGLSRVGLVSLCCLFQENKEQMKWIVPVANLSRSADCCRFSVFFGMGENWELSDSTPCCLSLLSLGWPLNILHT